MNAIADLLDQGAGAVSQRCSPLGLLQGTVSDNADRGNPGMVKVEFTAWQSGRSVSEWVPVLQPYAGGGYGCYVLPEVGDIVIIGFLGGDGKRPVVLGSFFPANSALRKQSFQAKNTVRRLRTKAGIDLSLSDEKGKETISATTPGGLALKMEDGEKALSLSDGGKNSVNLDCARGEVLIRAGSSVTIQVGGSELKLDARSGAVTLRCAQLSISAQQRAQIDGGQQLALDGVSVQLTGKQNAKLKGGALTEIQGGIVKLN